MSLPEAYDKLTKNILGNVNRTGHSVMAIGASDTEPTFTYTAGLYHSYKHPEIIVIGLFPEVAHNLLNDIGERAKEGNPFDLTRPVDDLIEGYSCVFQRIADREAHKWARVNNWLYKPNIVPTFQLIWPDADGSFPWSDNAQQGFIEARPVLAGYVGTSNSKTPLHVSTLN